MFTEQLKLLKNHPLGDKIIFLTIIFSGQTYIMKFILFLTVLLLIIFIAAGQSSPAAVKSTQLLAFPYGAASYSQVDEFVWKLYQEFSEVFVVRASYQNNSFIGCTALVN